jgi:hypothetical protein
LADRLQAAVTQQTQEVISGRGIPHPAELELDSRCPARCDVVGQVHRHCEAEGDRACLLFTEDDFSKNSDIGLRNSVKASQGNIGEVLVFSGKQIK